MVSHFESRERRSFSQDETPDLSIELFLLLLLLFTFTILGAVTALLTNPIWVVKTRMFTTPSSSTTSISSSTSNSIEQRKPQLPNSNPNPSPNRLQTLSTSSSTPTSASTLNPNQPNPNSHPYRTLTSSLKHIYKTEGFRGLWKGAGLALVGVSNGAIQFMAYEELKKWRSNVEFRKREERGEGLGEVDENGIAKLVSLDESLKDEPFSKLGDTELSLYLRMIPGEFGIHYHFRISKDGSYLFDLSLSSHSIQSSSESNFRTSYLLQKAPLFSVTLFLKTVLLSFFSQNHTTSHLYPTVLSCIKQTYKLEGPRAFYKGMAANAIRILPGTCVTFVVYENISFALRKAARSRVDAAALKFEETKSESS